MKVKVYFQKMRYTFKGLIICMLLGLILAGCQKKSESVSNASITETKDTDGTESLIANESDTDGSGTDDIDADKSGTNEDDDETGLSEEDIFLYEQAALYIQDGLREYDIEGEWETYFAPVDGKFLDVALVNGDSRWYEHLSYTYDEDAVWYTFEGQYEPIFTRQDANDFYFITDSDEIDAILENHDYVMEIGQYTDIPVPRRYSGENGWVEHDTVFNFGLHENDAELSYNLTTHLYTYYDERMDVDITIQYPQLSGWGTDMEDEARDSINEIFKTAFFYNYEWEEKEKAKGLQPRGEMYTYIRREFLITRQDEDYLSIRIYEYNDVRGANHPNEWETGITIDMHTGRLLTLEDVVGDKWTIQKLLESGKFKALWVWEPGSGSYEKMSQEWIDDLLDNIQRYGDEPLSAYDSDFYITDTSLGLITSHSRYYTNIEAEFSALGISDF